MMLFKQDEIISYLAFYDTKQVFVQTVFYNDKSYINIAHSDGNGWYTIKYCAFENEMDVRKISTDVIELLNEYYDNVKTVNHFI